LKSFSVLALLFLTGCIGLGTRESSVLLPDGKIYKVRCQSDGKVDYDDGAVKITVDNRGPAGQVFGAAGAAVMRAKELVEK